MTKQKIDKDKQKEMFIEVNDFQLYAKLLGEKIDKSTVIMDAGYGDYSKTWKHIAPEISKLTEVLIYDRAGLGKSGISSKKRTSKEMVLELHELLSNMELKPPYILVGHSFGGINMRLFATEYPNEVNGLVLIDSTPENYKDKFLPTMPKEFQEAYQKQFTSESTYSEFMESLKQVKEARRKLTVQLVVISAGKKDHYSEASQELWNDMQKELLSLSTKSDFIIAEYSTHYVQSDKPEIVINAIKALVDK
ncbi:alpha/beta fold hydrolase [Alkalicoccobacillus plakortidis]|uniref:Alpha/beta hydrolase n=1 Tax=Alkalicoccobacillus plakortidis TaxID=444060 RepID=A0ABT0XLT8_9BACI|nr:alpha/beta hydrolase [Alkalicoccobacillus plakortidis]MCM2676878.1 alpha/beta hydrolase [Alkalicoccobacillus plakortidis]